jgi:MraZ protein
LSGGAGFGDQRRAKGSGRARVFLSTFEKPLDSKRRFVVPADYRNVEDGSQDELFVFPCLSEPCLEAGGVALKKEYEAMVAKLPFGHDSRKSLTLKVFAQSRTLAYDTAGRITLPDAMCARFGLRNEVILVGMMDRFLIWEPEAYQPWAEKMERLADESIAALANVEYARLTGGES